MESKILKKRKIKNISRPVVSSQVVYSNNLKLDKITKSIDSRFVKMYDKISQIEDKIETEQSLRNTILSQKDEISELRHYINNIENSRKKVSEYNYFA